MVRRVRRSLRFRLIAACVLVEALMLTLIVGNSVRLADRHLAELAQSRTRAMADTATLALAPPLAARDHAALQIVVKRLGELTDVSYVALDDETGARIAAAGALPDPLPEPDPAFSDATPVHHVRHDIVLSGQPLGQLRYGLSTAALSAAKREMLIQGVALAVLAIFFSSFALVTVGVLLTARLDMLAKANLRVAAGDLRTVVEVHGDDEVAALSHAFNTMTAAVGDKVEQLEANGTALRAANGELQRLAEITAHHLHEPVRVLANHAQLLERRAGATLDSESREYLDFLVAGAKRAQELLSGLQSYVAIDMSPLPADVSADLNQCTARAREVLATKIAAAGATVTVDDMPRAHGDADQITTVLRLLMENALDHRGEQAPQVHVRASVDGGRVIVSITDNGPGVPQQFRERIFELFETLGRPATGTGFGLAAVRKIVRRHLGNVWITPGGTPPHGGGLTVHFTLPKAR